MTGRNLWSAEATEFLRRQARALAVTRVAFPGGWPGQSLPSCLVYGWEGALLNPHAAPPLTPRPENPAPFSQCSLSSPIAKWRVRRGRWLHLSLFLKKMVHRTLTLYQKTSLKASEDL